MKFGKDCYLSGVCFDAFWISHLFSILGLLGSMLHLDLGIWRGFAALVWLCSGSVGIPKSAWYCLKFVRT